MGITRNESVAGLVETYTKWFYSLCHQVQVPTKEYISILERRGYDRSRMVIFPRGIDTEQFAPRNGTLRATLGLENGITLLYAGRISKDKNLDFLATLYERIVIRQPRVNLLFVGDGPDLKEFQCRFQERPRVRFTGRVEHSSLPELYSLADLFVFPSTTDTFGMAVLEAQACGLPALVSDIGGPQEVILDGVTGWALSTSVPTAWEERIMEIIGQIQRAPLEYLERRHHTRKRIQEHFTWERFTRTIFDEQHPVDECEPAKNRRARKKAPSARMDRQLALC
jgi:glycosyltransferase involved in cell wall biosynthesis